MKQQITIKGQLNNIQNKEQIFNLMRLFGNAKRYAFNQITKKKLKKVGELEKDCYQKFIPNTRYSKDSVTQARWIIASKKECLNLNKEMLKNRINKLEYKLEKAKDNHKKHLIKNKIIKFENKLSKIEYLLKNKEIGKVIFGGRKNYEDFIKGKISKEEWKMLRNNELYSRGDKSKTGNPNLRIVNNQLRISDPVNDKKFFEYLYIPEKRRQFLDEKKYTILIKYVNGIFEVHITTDILKEKKYKLKNGAIGVDINPKSLNASIISRQGNYLGSREFDISEVLNSSTNKTINILGNNIKKIVNLAKWQNKGIVIENLKFKNKINSRRLNRLLKQFTYAKIIELFKTQCAKEGVELKLVNPAFTSFIGIVKYAIRYNMSSHNSASFVIGRRGLMFKEKIPFSFKGLVESSEERSKSWRKWSLLKKKLTALGINTVCDLHKLNKVSNSGEIPELEIAISGSNRTSERGFNVARPIHRFV